MEVKLSGWEFVEAELCFCIDIVTVPLCSSFQELHAVEDGGNQNDMSLTQVGDYGLLINSTQWSHLGQGIIVQRHGDSLWEER